MNENKKIRPNGDEEMNRIILIRITLLCDASAHSPIRDPPKIRRITSMQPPASFLPHHRRLKSDKISSTSRFLVSLDAHGSYSSKSVLFRSGAHWYHLNAFAVLMTVSAYPRTPLA